MNCEPYAPVSKIHQKQSNCKKEWRARPTVCLFISTLPVNAERPPAVTSRRATLRNEGRAGRRRFKKLPACVCVLDMWMVVNVFLHEHVWYIPPCVFVCVSCLTQLIPLCLSVRINILIEQFCQELCCEKITAQMGDALFFPPALSLSISSFLSSLHHPNPQRARCGYL